jgi:hypothetical protein
MSIRPYDDDPLDLDEEDEEERLAPGDAKRVCERCGHPSWFVRYDHVLEADRTVRVQWTCGGRDSDDWCERVAAVAERAEAEEEEAFEKMLAAKRQAAASLTPQRRAASLRLLLKWLSEKDLRELEEEVEPSRLGSPAPPRRGSCRSASTTRQAICWRSLKGMRFADGENSARHHSRTAAQRSG